MLNFIFRTVVVLLSLSAIFVGFSGLIALSDATLGVGMVGVGCLIAILARIVQARANTDELLDAIRKQNTSNTP